MDAATLHEQWHENNDRPAWVRANRDAINEHADPGTPVPDGSLYEVRQWLEDYKASVSGALNELVDDDGGSE